MYAVALRTLVFSAWGCPMPDWSQLCAVQWITGQWHKEHCPQLHADGERSLLVCRVTHDLEEVLAKIKAKEAEQAAFGQGEEEPLHKKLALVDKKAVAGNRTNMLSGNKTADSRKSGGPDPYSRKRTVEKNYWSTGTEKVKEETKHEPQEQVEVKQVRCSIPPPRQQSGLSSLTKL